MASAADEEPDRRVAELRVEAAMQGVLSYLRLHPESTDSLRGVLLWLRLLSYELSEPIVAEALKRLVALGEIEAWQFAGGITVYRCGRFR